MAKVKKRVKAVNRKFESPFQNYWTKNNYILLFAGIVTLIIGYFLLSQGPWDNPVSLSVAPIVLLIAYVVIFPLAIMYKKKNKSNGAEE
jgi:ATP/ADP translocase